MPKSVSTVTCILQNKATLPNNANAYGISIGIHESMGVILIQSTIQTYLPKMVQVLLSMFPQHLYSFIKEFIICSITV